MGAIQSLPISPEAALSALAVGAVGFGIVQATSSSTSPKSQTKPLSDSKKGKKKGKAAPAEVDSVDKSVISTPQPAPTPQPAIIPGQFDPHVPLPGPSSKKKKKKSKAPKTQPNVNDDSTDAVPTSSVDNNNTTQTEQHSDSSIDAEPQVKLPTKSKRQKKQQNVSAGSPSTAAPGSSQLRSMQQSIAAVDTDGSWTRVESRRRASASGPSQSDTGGLSTASDAGITSVTGGSDDEESAPPKSPVLRITPSAGEKPAEGFSWGDYEDVKIMDDTGDDGDDDDGWGVVKSRGRTKKATIPGAGSHSHPKVPETLSKRQRQNARKKEEQKAEKAAAEADRLVRLGKHKKELEKEGIAKAYGVGTSKKAIGGGMTANVDERGKLVWE